MRAVVLPKVVHLPNQTVALARCQTIGPQVRPPEQQRAFDFVFGRVVVQRRIAFDLFEDEIPNGKPVFVGVRFRVQTGEGIAAVDAGGKINNAQIGVALLGDLQVLHNVLVHLFIVLGKFPVFGRVDAGLLKPDGLHLLRRHPRLHEATFRNLPHRRVGIVPFFRIFAAFAASTIASSGDFAGSASASFLNTEYSMVVLDMPMESNTIFPLGEGLPRSSSGTIFLASARAAFRCMAGG